MKAWREFHNVDRLACIICFSECPATVGGLIDLLLPGFRLDLRNSPVDIEAPWNFRHIGPVLALPWGVREQSPCDGRVCKVH